VTHIRMKFALIVKQNNRI